MRILIALLLATSLTAAETSEEKVKRIEAAQKQLESAKKKANDPSELKKEVDRLRRDNRELRIELAKVKTKLAKLEKQYGVKTLKAVADASLPASVQVYFTNAEKARENEIRSLERSIKEAKQKFRLPANTAFRADVIKSAKATLARDEPRLKILKQQVLKERREKLRPTYVLSIGVNKLGQIGVLRATDQVVVSQVVDDNTMLITIIKDKRGFSIAPNRTTTVIGNKIKTTAWVKGIKTAGMVDGQRFQSQQLFQVTGTKQYETTVGRTRTVFVVEPFNITPYLKK